jgi:hypothetical protein
MTNRTCTKCESTKDESLFLKKRFLCKDCDNVARRESRLKKLAEQTDEPKKCNICEETKTTKDFPPNSLKCRKCNSKVKKQRAIKVLEDQIKQGITKKTCIKCNNESDLDKFRPGENVCNTCQKQMLYEWRDENPDKFKAVCKTYREKDDKKVLINNYRRENYKNNPINKISLNYRCKLREFINKDITSEKEKELKKIFGCKREKFRNWIEFCFKPEMTWDNYDEVWNFDHIQPCCSFDLTDENELKQCFNWKTQCLFYVKKIIRNLIK